MRDGTHPGACPATRPAPRRRAALLVVCLVAMLAALAGCDKADVDAAQDRIVQRHRVQCWTFSPTPPVCAPAATLGPSPGPWP